MKPKKQSKKDELAETKALMMRVQADFENYRKRAQKEKEEYGKYFNTDLIARMLPVLDNFRLALKHQPKDFKDNGFLSGIGHIERQFEQIFTEEGVEKIPTEGQKFDPHLHEAVEEISSEKPPGQITEEVLAGYKLGDRIIRHAKVKVSRGETSKQKADSN